MRIDLPNPKPRDNGDYQVDVTSGYGKPNADIRLDEKGHLRLQYLDEGDCDRLIRAAAMAKEQILRYRAEASVWHGRAHFYEGECQLCGKLSDDTLHADAPAPSGLQQPASVVRVVNRPADRCRCGHIALNHHLNTLTDELRYCNECPDDCAVFKAAETASATS